MKIKKIQSLLFGKFFLLIALFLMSIDIPSVLAGMQNSARGFGWGGSEVYPDGSLNGNESGPGWISFNSIDCDADNNGYKDSGPCGGDNFSTRSYDYGVNIPPADGNLSGYAWSDNFGWISFNSVDVAGCPLGDCVAKRIGNTITGWARILSQDIGGSLSGFISLDSVSGGSNEPYGAVLNGNNLSGYVWSEFGWIDFSGVNIAPVQTIKICKDSCSSGIRRQMPSFLLSQGGSEVLFACMGTGVCSGDDIPVSANWSEDSTVPYSDAIDRNPITNPSSSVTIQGKSVGQEKITATYNSFPTDTVAQVVCSDTAGVCNDLSVGAKSTCSGEKYTLNYIDICTGVASSKQCDGQRHCNFNWEETVP